MLVGTSAASKLSVKAVNGVHNELQCVKYVSDAVWVLTLEALDKFGLSSTYRITAQP